MRLPFAGFTLFSAALASGQAAAQCKTFPGDKKWPKVSEWDNFNKTVGGRLVATVPLGAPCHDPAFNNATCGSLQDQWQLEKIQCV